MLQYTCVISRFRRGVNEIFALLEFYAASIGICRRFGTTYWSHHKGSSSFYCLTPEESTDIFPETSATKYKSTLRKIPEDRISYRTIIFFLYCRNTAAVRLH